MVGLVRAQQYGTCDEPFLIFKHTVATTDSHLACENAYKIFPVIHDEGADKFHDGEFGLCVVDLANDT